MSKASRVASIALATAALASAAGAQSVKEVVGTTPWETVNNEPPPKLLVDPPLPEPLSRGAIVIQYRVENFHILPLVGAAAVGVSPRGWPSPHRCRWPAMALGRRQ